MLLTYENSTFRFSSRYIPRPASSHNKSIHSFKIDGKATNKIVDGFSDLLKTIWKDFPLICDQLFKNYLIPFLNFFHYVQSHDNFYLDSLTHTEPLNPCISHSHLKQFLKHNNPRYLRYRPVSQIWVNTSITFSLSNDSFSTTQVGEDSLVSIIFTSKLNSSSKTSHLKTRWCAQ